MVNDGARSGLGWRTRLTRKREYDEDDVRVRPSRSSRPRTRTRPKHSDAVEGFVVAVDRGRYTCHIAGTDAVVTAMRARELGRRGVVVGDNVQIVGDVTGRPDTLARIVRIDDRRSVLMRTADDEEGSTEGRFERVVVANAEQLVIVNSLHDPPPRTGFIDRCLVAAYDAEIEPLLCLTKGDLAGPEAVLDYYSELDLPYVLCRPGEPIDDLVAALSGKVSVMIGHSGVGKSTLVNRLVPGTDRAVGVVSAVGKGRHTSTSAVALRLPESRRSGGWIIDTPGVRSFGLAHVSADSLLHGFPDLVEASTRCAPNCDHTGAGGECGLDMLVAEGGADPRRLASFRRLLASKEGTAEPTAEPTEPTDEAYEL
ncbi:ribosome small subunit-dependent GTPase A [Dactylosporangium sp. NPDC049742]|uniref:ribosome small subunit-dependent GTPase A n=1 Tax=Dactylosporangium sp. NPDC049742 TaxID=3154737 RepID=UPI003412571C